MSNDSKFWAARIAFWVLSTIDGSLGVKLATDAGRNGHVALGWTLLFLLLTGATVYSWLMFRSLKNKRWSKGPEKTLNQIEVEALAAYGAQQHKDPTPPTNPHTPDKPQNL
jgi:hypothetical protein